MLERLAAQGIEAGLYVPAVHHKRTLALPFFPQLDHEDQQRVVETLGAAIA